MTRGRHTRRRTKRAYQIRSAAFGFVAVAICAAAIFFVATRHDDTATTQAGAAHPATSAPRNNPATSAATSSTSKPGAPSSTAAATTTSTTHTSKATGGKSLTGKIVVIDPGHDGGNASHAAEINRLVPAGGFDKACDTAGTETDDGYPEHAFTFDVSTRLAADLRARGATVFLTRTNDTGVGPCVNERAAAGGEHHANVAISIHADGGPPGGRGFHVLPPAGCSGCNNSIVAPSADFARILRDTFRNETPMPTSTYAGSDGIMPRTDLAGINLSAVPKVFIECGNMRNATDASMLKDPSFRQMAADAIADGITSYLGGS